MSEERNVWCPECQYKMIYSHTVRKELEEHFRRGEVWVCKDCGITRYVEHENNDSNEENG